MPDARREPRPLPVSVLSQMDPAFPRTHSIAALRLCAGLASQGHDVELVVPAITKPTPDAGRLFDTYGLEQNFDVRYLSVGRGNGATAAGQAYDAKLLRRLLGRHLLSATRPGRTAVMISDGIRLAFPYVAVARARMGGRNVLTTPWLHEFQGTRLERFVCANADCILATNTTILGDLADAGIPTPLTFVTGNPVPRARLEFGKTCSREEARRHLGLDRDRPVVAYTGKLYLGMRELEYLLEAASRMPDCLFLFTGGQPEVIARLREQLRDRGIENVQLAGMLPDPEETRYYQQAASVLVTYYSLDDLPYASRHVPSKLAEYMTTGNPIVAADFPAVRDLLRSDNSWLVPPHDVRALTEALRSAIDDPDRSARLAARARDDIGPKTSEAVGAALGTFLAEASESLGKKRLTCPPKTET